MPNLEDFRALLRQGWERRRGVHKRQLRSPAADTDAFHTPPVDGAPSQSTVAQLRGRVFEQFLREMDTLEAVDVGSIDDTRARVGQLVESVLLSKGAASLSVF